MINILVYRSIRPESMSIIIANIRKRFGENIKINILSRPENQFIMKEIHGVNNVHTFNGSSFKISLLRNEDKQNLLKYKFDLIVIPISGHYLSYRNIVKLSSKLFKKTPIYFCKFPNIFFEYKNTINQTIINYLVTLFSVILCVPLLITYLFIVLIYSIAVNESN